MHWLINTAGALIIIAALLFGQYRRVVTRRGPVMNRKFLYLLGATALALYMVLLASTKTSHKNNLEI
jgi:hypothetical protein